VGFIINLSLRCYILRFETTEISAFIHQEIKEISFNFDITGRNKIIFACITNLHKITGSSP